MRQYLANFISSNVSPRRRFPLELEKHKTTPLKQDFKWHCLRCNARDCPEIFFRACPKAEHGFIDNRIAQFGAFR